MATTATSAASGGSAYYPVDAPPGPIYVDTQHEDVVHDAQMDYYGSKLATCSSDRTVKIYNVSESSYEICATLQGHEGPVWQVAWAHPKFGVLLASCSFDGSVFIHRQVSTAAAVSSSSTTGGIVSSSRTSRSVGSGMGRHGTTTNVATTTNAPTATANAATTGESWTTLYTARGLHESSVNGLSFAPHEYGLQLASASADGRISILRYEPSVAVVGSHSYQQQQQQQGTAGTSWQVEYIQDCPMGVNAVSWAPYGAYYMPRTASTDGDIPYYDDSPRLVTAGCDNQIRIWKYQNYGNDSVPSGTNPDDPYQAYAAAAGSTPAWITEPMQVVALPGTDATAAAAASIPLHSDWVRDVAWRPTLLPGYNVIASASEDGTVLIWTQDCTSCTTPDTVAASSPWTCELLHQFHVPVWRVSWSVTGHLLAVSAGDSIVTLWKAGKDGMTGWTQVGAVEDEGTSGTAAPPPS